MGKRKRTIVINGEIVAVQQQQVVKFQEEIETLVSQGGMEYLEAILHFCSVRDIDPETVKDLISPPLYSKIYKECADKHLIKVDQAQFV